MMHLIRRGEVRDGVGIRGWGYMEVFSPSGVKKLHVPFGNLVTEVGDQYYGERAAGIASPPDQVTGMRLGTDSTTPAKSGAGAAIVSYISGSAKALDASYPQSSKPGAARRITFRVTWDPGEATQNGIAECVLTNQTPLGDVAGSAADTIARALISPLADKEVDDTLIATWHHDILAS